VTIPVTAAGPAACPGTMLTASRARMTPASARRASRTGRPCRTRAQSTQAAGPAGRGTVPAGLLEEIHALFTPPVPWDVALGRWMEQNVPMVREKLRTYARANCFDRPDEFVSEHRSDIRFVCGWHGENVQVGTTQATGFDAKQHIVRIFDLRHRALLHFEPTVADEYGCVHN